MKNESAPAVFAIEVNHPIRGWVRLQTRYRTKAAARGWYSFIKAVWHGLPLRTVPVPISNKPQKEAAK